MYCSFVLNWFTDIKMFIEYCFAGPDGQRYQHIQYENQRVVSENDYSANFYFLVRYWECANRILFTNIS
jgi:hypothetical protein